MRLNKRQSYFRTTDERLLERRKVNWGKYLYFAVLGLIILAAGYYFASGYLYAEGDGQVILDKLYIQHTRDIRVVSINVKEGDSVEKNDVLFTYDEGDGNGHSLQAPSTAFYYSPDLEREISRTIQMISLREIDRKVYAETLEQFRGEYGELKRQAILDAYIPGRLDGLQKNIRDTESLIAKTGEELKVQGVYLRRLRGINGTAAQKNRQEALASTGAAARTDGIRKFMAMEEGVVTRIYPNNYEVVIKGDTIMEIYKPEEVNIKAFFEQKHINYLSNSKMVSVEFPDGTKGKGVIKRYYFATQPLPPEFQKRYEPVKRNIVVDIVPPTREDALSWKSFYKLSVKVFVKKFN